MHVNFFMSARWLPRAGAAGALLLWCKHREPATMTGRNRRLLPALATNSPLDCLLYASREVQAFVCLLRIIANSNSILMNEKYPQTLIVSTDIFVFPS